jgi:hypothetical protein
MARITVRIIPTGKTILASKGSPIAPDMPPITRDMLPSNNIMIVPNTRKLRNCDILSGF